MLALWRHAPIGAPAPGPVTPPPPPPPPPPRRSLREVEVSLNKPPDFARLVFPDNYQHAVKYWKDLLVGVVKWLADTGKLTSAECPVQFKGMGNYLIHTTPHHPSRSPFRVRVPIGNLYLEANHSAESCVKYSLRLLDKFGVDAARVRVE